MKIKTVKKNYIVLFEVILISIIASTGFSVAKSVYDDPSSESANQQHLHLEDFRLNEKRVYKKDPNWDYEKWLKENKDLFENEL
jgi:hypothetical protein